MGSGLKLRIMIGGLLNSENMEFKKVKAKRFFRTIEIIGLVLIGIGLIYRYGIMEDLPDSQSISAIEEYFRQEEIVGWIQLPGYILFGIGVVFEIVSPFIFRQPDNSVTT